MNRLPHPSLRLLAELRRLERLALRFAEPADPDEVWRALRDMPRERADEPVFGTRWGTRWLAGRILPLRYPALTKPYGEVIHFHRSCFFSTEPVPFTGILTGQGEPAVAFRAMVRHDLAPLVLRFAVDRLCASRGWRFPQDLASSELLDAILDLAFADDPTCRFALASHDVPDGAEGEMSLTAMAPEPGDPITLCWSAKRLAFRSARYGWL